MSPPASPCSALLFVAAIAGAAPAQDPAPRVDLSGDQYDTMQSAQSQQPAGDRQWFERFDVWGYVSGAYFHTEAGGEYPGGALLVDQASLFVQAEVTAQAVAFFELRTDLAPSDEIETGEVYIDLRRLLPLGDGGHLGFKFGRFDIPFGEYYHLQDAPENPLVSYPVVMPYGVDEGILAYGNYRGLGFALALSDGSYDRQSFAGVAPAVTARLSGEPTERLYVSASVLHGDDAPNSALCMSGGTLAPVGAGTFSTLGASPSTSIGYLVGGVDLRWEPWTGAMLRASYAHAEVDDDVDAFDRGLDWFILEPSVAFADRWRVTARWSEAGTFSSAEGYRFQGNQFARGRASFGYDLRNMRRLALGLRWQPEANLIAKLEVGLDQLTAIDASPIADDDRAYVAAQIVLRF